MQLSGISPTYNHLSKVYVCIAVYTCVYSVCIIVCMKQRIQITLDDEAILALAEIDNKSQYIENLILGSPQTGNSTPQLNSATLILEMEEMTRALLAEAVIELKESLKQTPQTNTFVPKPPDPEKGYPCCSGRSPCKHWVWDNVDTVWKNTITGLTRES